MPRFMMILRSSPSAESGVDPSINAVKAMGKYYMDMKAAGIVHSAEGLHTSSLDSARIIFPTSPTSTPEIKKGPYPIEELFCGYWIIETKSLEEAIEWVKKCPMYIEGEEDQGGVVELRRIVEADDFKDMARAWEEETGEDIRVLDTKKQ